MRWRTRFPPLAGYACLVVACSADPTASEPTPTESPPPIVTESTTTETPPLTASESTPTEPPPPEPPSSPPDVTSTVRATDPAAGASTSTTQPEPDCDPDAMVPLADAVVDRARLAPGGEWTVATSANAFAERTNPPAEFAHRTGGLDCSVRIAQTADDGAERLFVAAWTGDRAMYVLQAADAPRRAYSQDARFQLMVDQLDGEWLQQGFEWAGTMAGGESIVVGSVDGPIAVAAKAWPAGIPRFEDLPVTTATEEYGIEVLTGAGARNVSVADPAGPGSEIAALQFVTPAGLHLVATVASPEWFAPDAEVLPGAMTVEEIAGVEVHVTVGEPDAYAVASVGWACGDHVWFIDSPWGTVDELRDWTAQMIEAGGCAT